MRSRTSFLALSLVLTACSGGGSVLSHSTPALPQAVSAPATGLPTSLDVRSAAPEWAVEPCTSPNGALEVTPISLSIIDHSSAKLTACTQQRFSQYKVCIWPGGIASVPLWVTPTQNSNGLWSAIIPVTARAVGRAELEVSVDQEAWKHNRCSDTGDPSPTTARLWVTVVRAVSKIYVITSGNYVDTGAVMTYLADGTRTTPTITGLHDPEGIAVDSTGKIYIANGLTNAITTYTENGTPTTPTITDGLSSPSGVAVDAAGKIYVVNNGTLTVTTYKPDGTRTTPTITVLPLPGTNTTAHDVATVDRSHSRVQNEGHGAGEVCGISVDAAGKIYVVNCTNNFVRTYKPDGTPTAPTITQGLIIPVGLTVDAAGKVYVANEAGGNVTTYLPDGKRTSPTIDTVQPVGVAADSAGKIYVASYGDGTNGSVTSYESNGTPVSPTISGLERLFGIAIH